MRALVLLVCLAVGCLAQIPQPCSPPPKMTGMLSAVTQNEKLMAFAKFTYDRERERVRFREFGSYDNKTFHLDVLLLFKERVMYKINWRNRTCCKKPLNVDVHPLVCPKNATLLGQSVLGSSSAPQQGVLVNTWVGEVDTKKGTVKYIRTVTDDGCVPVSSLFHTDKQGWVVISFFNNVMGLVDPQQLIPPYFCRDAQSEEEDGEGPVNFFSMF